MYQASVDEGSIWLVMDYCEGGDLHNKASDTKTYLGNDKLIRSVFLQLVDTVSRLHAVGIYHLDLKPSNIMVSADGKTVSVGDFGNATTQPIIHNFFNHGTAYSAPEAHGCSVLGRGALLFYSAPHADIWSLGVIFVALLTQRQLWHTPDHSDINFACFIQKSLTEPDHLLRPLFDLPIGAEANTIIRGLLQLDPVHRTPLAELRKRILEAKRFTMTREEFLHHHPSKPLPPHLPIASALPMMDDPPELLSPIESRVPDGDRPKKRARREANAT